MSETLAYSVPDAGLSLSVSKATFWRLIANDELPSFKLGARTLIRADALRAFVDKLSAATPPAV